MTADSAVCVVLKEQRPAQLHSLNRHLLKDVFH